MLQIWLIKTKRSSCFPMKIFTENRYTTTCCRDPIRLLASSFSVEFQCADDQNNTFTRKNVRVCQACLDVAFAWQRNNIAKEIQYCYKQYHSTWEVIFIWCFVFNKSDFNVSVIWINGWHPNLANSNHELPNIFEFMQKHHINFNFVI